MTDQPCPFSLDTQKSTLCFHELRKLRDDARRLKGKVEQLRAELAEAQAAREQAEARFLESQARNIGLRADYKLLERAYLNLNREMERME